MKRNLLTFALLATTTLGFAQNETVKLDFDRLRQNTSLEVVSSRDAKTAFSISNGLYFDHTPGFLYRGMSKKYMYMKRAFIQVPPMVAINFTNKSAVPEETAWIQVNNGQRQTIKTNTAEDKDFAIERTGFSGVGYSVPGLASVDGKVFWINEDIEQFDEKTHDAILEVGNIVTYDEDKSNFMDLSFTNSAYGPFSLAKDNSTGLALGPGVTTFNDEKLKITGFTQVLPKLMSKLYCDELTLFTVVYSTDGTFKKSVDPGTTLTVKVYGLNPDTTINRDKLLYTLTGTYDDCTNLNEKMENLSSEGFPANITYNFGQTITLKNRTAEGWAPFILDEPCALVCEDFEAPGVNMGLLINKIEPTDRSVGRAGISVRTVEGNEERSLYWPGAVYFTVHGLYDYADVESSIQFEGDQVGQEGMNVIRVSADGKTITTEGKDGKYNVGAIYATTHYPWMDEFGIEQYQLINKPDWLKYTVDESARMYTDPQNSQLVYNTGEVHLSFTCDPLPEGVTGRTAYMHIEGAGVYSKNPIIILQGDSNVADAINNVDATVKKNNFTYNLAGQRVNDDYKGIVIKNGKKMVNK